jgi:hypothetical protein
MPSYPVYYAVYAIFVGFASTVLAKASSILPQIRYCQFATRLRTRTFETVSFVWHTVASSLLRMRM